MMKKKRDDACILLHSQRKIIRRDHWEDWEKTAKKEHFSRVARAQVAKMEEIRSTRVENADRYIKWGEGNMAACMSNKQTWALCNEHFYF